jgi:hypothetical protein
MVNEEDQLTRLAVNQEKVGAAPTIHPKGGRMEDMDPETKSDLECVQRMLNHVTKYGLEAETVLWAMQYAARGEPVQVACEDAVLEWIH